LQIRIAGADSFDRDQCGQLRVKTEASIGMDSL
jgi:hypothetical protein